MAVEVSIEFPNLTEEQHNHLYRAVTQLRKAGVSFDTGYDFCEKKRVWELDWSLKGANVVLKKK